MRANRGFTMVEVAITLAVFSVMMTTIFMTLNSGLGMLRRSGTRIALQDSAREALDIIARDLRQSGRVTLDGVEYPFVYRKPGAPLPVDLRHHENYAAQVQFRQIVPAAAYSTGMIIVLPEDMDGDGFMTDAVTGEIEWSDSRIDYVIAGKPDGTNSLYRRVNVTDEVVEIARNVERVYFEDWSTPSGLLTDPSRPLGLNQIRVTIWMFEQRGQNVRIETSGISTTVGMRNIEESF